MKESSPEITEAHQTEPSASRDDDSRVGHDIGPYRIEREIGRGGMGTVYEAWRADGEFKHRVAIKLIRGGLDRDFVLRRFRNERQILAALDHPNIGRLLGGGTTEEGSPYFVMEYIAGQPLYQYADTHNLSVTERLRLFIQLSDSRVECRLSPGWTHQATRQTSAGVLAVAGHSTGSQRLGRSIRRDLF